MNDGPGTILWRQTERHDHTSQPLHEDVVRIVLAETRADETGMQAVRGDAGAFQPPRQLAREENIAQLRGAIEPERTVFFLALQIVEIELAGFVRVRRRRQD